MASEVFLLDFVSSEMEFVREIEFYAEIYVLYSQSCHFYDLYDTASTLSVGRNGIGFAWRVGRGEVLLLL